MEDRMTRIVVILSIVIVWAFILTQNVTGKLDANRSEIDASASICKPIFLSTESPGHECRPIKKGGEISEKQPL